MRIKIYKEFKNLFKNDKDGLKQQLFLNSYVERYYDQIDRLLLYHGIGTGKTRSSIIIAEKIMKINPKMKPTIILPARLKTNYIDELKTYFIDNKLNNKNYDIYSYEFIINKFKKSTNVNKTLKEFTKNRIIIIDEFHNLIGSNIKEEIIDKIHITNKIDLKIKNIRSILMRFISKYADNSCKMFFLTATPVFDNLSQFVELVKLLNVQELDFSKIKRASDLIPFLKGKVSYYANYDKTQFPKVIYKNLDIPITEPLDEYMSLIRDGDEDNDTKIDNEKFLIKQRQSSITCFPDDMNNNEKTKIKNLKLYAPKIAKLLEIINEKQKGKVVVYSNFIEKGLYQIKNILDKNGWNNYDPSSQNSNSKYKNYIIWDGKLKDDDKIKIKAILNSSNNKDGSIIKLILGSPSIKEGISFKHIQSLHVLDPVWNKSSKEQIEGRCIRFQSHNDITEKDYPTLKKEVIIYYYVLTHTNTSSIQETSDERIYNAIIPKKEAIVDKLIRIIKDISIDKYLYKEMSKSPTQSSLISLKSDNNVILKNRNRKDIIIKNDDNKIKEICNNFFKNSNVNPITGRMIKENGTTYKSFLKKCSKYKNNN
jgi:hypothetical protein